MTEVEPLYDRPPEGLARGTYAAPSWVILALAGVALAFAIVLVAAAIRRAVRGMTRSR